MKRIAMCRQYRSGCGERPMQEPAEVGFDVDIVRYLSLITLAR